MCFILFYVIVFIIIITEIEGKATVSTYQEKLEGWQKWRWEDEVVLTWWLYLIFLKILKGVEGVLESIWFNYFVLHLG